MPAQTLRPLDGLSAEDAAALWTVFDRAYALSLVFSAGPGIDAEGFRQAMMSALNKAEEMGLITILHPASSSSESD